MDRASLAQEVNQLHAELCAALADPTRIMLLYGLVDMPHCVSDLAEALGIPQAAASRHLKMLRERGLVRAVRQAQSVEYRLTDPRLIEALDLLRSVLRDGLARRADLAEAAGSTTESN